MVDEPIVNHTIYIFKMLSASVAQYATFDLFWQDMPRLLQHLHRRTMGQRIQLGNGRDATYDELCDFVASRKPQMQRLYNNRQAVHRERGFADGTLNPIRKLSEKVWYVDIVTDYIDDDGLMVELALNWQNKRGITE